MSKKSDVYMYEACVCLCSVLCVVNCVLTHPSIFVRFGLLLYEVLTRRHPTKQTYLQLTHGTLECFNVIANGDGHQKMAEAVVAVVRACVADKPEHRPSFAEIIDNINFIFS